MKSHLRRHLSSLASHFPKKKCFRERSILPLQSPNPERNARKITFFETGVFFFLNIWHFCAIYSSQLILNKQKKT